MGAAAAPLSSAASGVGGFTPCSKTCEEQQQQQQPQQQQQQEVE
jgi:hypothetical protein